MAADLVQLDITIAMDQGWVEEASPLPCDISSTQLGRCEHSHFTDEETEAGTEQSTQLIGTE